ncbi:MAG: hypothetical protein ACOX8U_10705 [Bradymonadia bacterium]|jgi:hypothetical protein
MGIGNDKGNFNPFSAAKQASGMKNGSESKKRVVEGAEEDASIVSGPRAVIPKGVVTRAAKTEEDKAEAAAKELEQEPEEAHLETEHGVILGSELVDEDPVIESAGASGASLLEQMAAFDMEHSAMYSEVTDVSDLEAAAMAMDKKPSEDQEAVWAAQMAADEEAQWAAQHAEAQEAQWAAQHAEAQGAQWSEQEYQAHASAPQPERQRPNFNMDFDFDEGASKRSYFGVVVAIIIVIALIGAVAAALHFLLLNKAEQETASVAEEVAEKQESRPLISLETVEVGIDLPKDAKLMINGDLHELEDSGRYPMIKGKTNQITVYRDGYLPEQVLIPSESLGEDVVVEFKSDEGYLRGKMAISMDESQYDSKVKVYFDGQLLPSLPTVVSNVVLGFPHHLIIEKEGFGRHLSVWWPNRVGTTDIRVPTLVETAQAIRETSIKSELPISRAKPFKIKIQTTEHVLTEQGDIAVLKNDFLHYTVSRENRKDANFVLNPANFGSAVITFFLNTESLGTADVKFLKAKKVKNVGICFRRVGEVICPDMDGSNVIPSGDWEVMGYTIQNEEKYFLRGNFTQPLKVDYSYEFIAATTKPEFFEMGMQTEPKKRSP